MSATAADLERWELLLDAVVSMAADLSLDGLLDRIVEVAAKLVDAKYAALGVLDPGSERRLQTFVYHGISPEQAAKIGPLPEGHGLLGLIIDRPEPLRLHDIGEHSASYGFPPNHPAMHTFLGVPVRTKGKVFGNLYLSERRSGGDFTEQDERIVIALAAAAGVAIENAGLYDAVQRRERWLRASNEISTALVGLRPGQPALQVVADKAREVAEADACWIVSGTDTLQVEAISGMPVAMSDVRRVPLQHSLAQEVLTKNQPVLIERMSEDGRTIAAAGIPGWPELGPGILVPFRGGDTQPGVDAGVLVLAWTPEHAARRHQLDPRLPASFAEQAALALQITRSQLDRERLALFEDRDRIARDLHDVVVQRLFALGLSLQGASRLGGVPPELSQRIEHAIDELDTTIRDIRRTIFELGATPQDHDFQTEVTRIVQRAAATLKCRPTLTFEGPVRSRIGPEEAPDLLAVLSEALSNTARHADPSRVEVRLSVDDREARLEVADDGPGIRPGVVESGLRNMRRRAEQRGGRFDVESGPNGGALVSWRIPLP